VESIGWLYPNINPILLELPGPFAIRWYGMMYLVGFTIGFLILRRLAKTGRLPVNVEQVGELLGLLALGVIVGGRLGYVLFYNPSMILNNPLEIFVLWEGGLSFHGGLIGVAAAFWWFARRAGVPFLTMADGIVLAAPPGIAGVRLANFINGELYGRVAAESVPWAMRFPTDPVALRLMGTSTARPEEIYRAVRIARADGSWQQIAVAALRSGPRGGVPLRRALDTRVHGATVRLEDPQGCARSALSDRVWRVQDLCREFPPAGQAVHRAG